jgi:hypothetical protein
VEGQGLRAAKAFKEIVGQLMIVGFVYVDLIEDQQKSLLHGLKYTVCRV